MQCGLNELLSQRRFSGEKTSLTVLLNQLTVADDRHAVADAFHYIHFMRNKENRQAQATVNVF